MENSIVAKNYQLSKKLGNGAFGEIWQATHLKTREEVAIKFEEINSKHQQLYAECKIYLWFHSDSTVLAQAIPQVLYYGVEGNKNIMVMDLLGLSLEDAFTKCNRKLSVKTVLMLADQMLKRVEYIHSRRIIHRDIIPWYTDLWMREKIMYELYILFLLLLFLLLIFNYYYYFIFIYINIGI